MVAKPNNIRVNTYVLVKSIHVREQLNRHEQPYHSGEREDLEQLRVVGTRFGAASAREGEDLEELHVVGTRVRAASTREEANAGGTSGRPLSTPLPGRDRREVAHHHRGAGRRRRGFGSSAFAGTDLVAPLTWSTPYVA